MSSMFKPKDWKNIPRHALSATEIVSGLAKLDGWKLDGDGANVAIEKTFSFANYFETIAFVNALAFIRKTTIRTCRCTTTAAWCASTRTTWAGSRAPTSNARARRTRWLRTPPHDGTRPWLNRAAPLPLQPLLRRHSTTVSLLPAMDVIALSKHPPASG
jgi:hypothetical protein